VDEHAVINASPLILLGRSVKLFLLQEFSRRILVPDPVARKIAARGDHDATVKAMAASPWIEISSSPTVGEEIVSWGLGLGESSVLAIAQANPGMTAIIDDLCGRKCAASLGIPVRGTLGIVLAAKQRGVIERASPVLEDLISAGTVGLVKAARSFDPTREVEFKTYAYIRIRGAVIDELRRNSFVPSNVHQELRQIEETYRRMSSKNGKPPSDEQLARESNLPLEKMYKLLQEGRHQHFLSIHGLNEEQSPLQGLVPPDHEPSPDQQAERKEMLEVLTDALMELSERDRHVLLLYYDRDLTMKETAEVLGVTESRVSQLHASALFKLSMKLGRS